jgi:hypothetical protein
MRMPAAKIWRAFPELDRFSDEECAVYVARLNRWRVQGGAWAAAVLCGAALVAATPWAVVASGPALSALGVDAGRTDVQAGLAVLGAVLLGAGAPLTGLLTRDRLLKRAVRRKLRKAICARCGHSLLGLPLANACERASVRCPECGFVISLELLGLSHEDLNPSAAPHPPVTRRARE